MANRSLTLISSLIPLLVQSPDCHEAIINGLTVTYSKLFRDPYVYLKLKQEVFPYLATYSRVTVWVAGCADGEEAYSMAILLEEAGLLERTRIYATDISAQTLRRASSGVLKLGLDADVTTRYHQSGGKYSLADYFVSADGKQKLKQHFLSKIIFEKHDLVQQPGFISAELILCRNVLIYFAKRLQKQVMKTMLTS